MDFLQQQKKQFMLEIAKIFNCLMVNENLNSENIKSFNVSKIIQLYRLKKKPWIYEKSKKIKEMHDKISFE